MVIAPALLASLLSGIPTFYCPYSTGLSYTCGMRWSYLLPIRGQTLGSIFSLSARTYQGDEHPRGDRPYESSRWSRLYVPRYPEVNWDVVACSHRQRGSCSMYDSLLILPLLLLPLPHLLPLLLGRDHHYHLKFPLATLTRLHILPQHSGGNKGVCLGLLSTSVFICPPSLYPYSTSSEEDSLIESALFLFMQLSMFMFFFYYGLVVSFFL